MKMKYILLVVAVASSLLVSCATQEKMVDLRDYPMPLRGEVRVGSSLNPDWNVDVWMGVKNKLGRPASFALLPQGSMVWEAADYKGFYLYAEAWRYDQDNRKIVMARIKNPERVKVYRYTNWDGYGWSVEIRMDDDGDLYLHQKLHLSRGGWDYYY